MKIYHHMQELIGHTPILELNHIQKEKNLQASIYAKLECFNPAGSSKDRVALQMILDAKDKGLLKEGATIIEPTSGNTGIGLCAVASTFGYHAIIVMPDTMSQERITLMKAYGAKVVLTPGHLGMQGAIDQAEALSKEIDNSFIPGQFVNPSNPKAHYLSTGPEIDEQMDGHIDIFIAGVGTGGTLTGVGQYLKEKHPHTKIIAVEPADSPLLSKGYAVAHKIQGIGANFIPEILDTSLYDDVMTISTKEAYDAVHNMAKYEGILIGISSGAALHAAITLASQKENKDKNIVVLFPDSGDRYLSTDLFE